MNGDNFMSITQIQDLSIPELDIYTKLSENQLRHIYEPAPGIFIAESPKVIERALNAAYEPISLLVEDKHIKGEAKELIEKLTDIPIYTGPFDLLTKLTGFNLTRGALCAMRRKTYPTVTELCQDAHRIAILEDVVNPTNIGAIFRSAAAMNIDAILLTPGCADPLYRRAARVSMGTVFQIPWTYMNKKTLTWPSEGMKLLHELGFKTAAMALKDDTISIDAPVLKSIDRLAIILGTEGEGLKDETIEACDYTVKIPMRAGIDSLNVAAASAVAFWELGNFKRKND